MKQETLEEAKDLAYWKKNAEEDYLKVPISVLRYISELEKRSYSEEEVIDLINLRTCDLDLAYSKKPIYYLKTKEWFEQFKKKKDYEKHTHITN